jgi:hypothetical protein
MLFQQYKAFFGPDELATLTAAFDATWRELRSSGVDLSTQQKIVSMKKKLALRILVSATAGGVRDVETMKEQALRSLACGARLTREKPQLQRQLRSRLA